MKFISHQRKETEGVSIMFMEEKGRAFGRLYFYDNDSTMVLLSDLSVSPEDRKQGIGRQMQEIREQMAINSSATTAYLWVEKDSWMQEWYRRRGYEDYADKEDEENKIWMKKTLIKK